MITSQAETEPKEATISIQGGEIAYVGQGNLLEPYFREPFETSIMIFPDYDIATWSTHHDGIIFGTVNERMEYLKSIGRRLEDVIAIIHNHNTPHGFSGGDELFFYDLRAHDYPGKYGIYYPFKKTNRILWMKEK